MLYIFPTHRTNTHIYFYCQIKRSKTYTGKVINLTWHITRVFLFFRHVVLLLLGVGLAHLWWAVAPWMSLCYNTTPKNVPFTHWGSDFIISWSIVCFILLALFSVHVRRWFCSANWLIDTPVLCRDVERCVVCVMCAFCNIL